MELDLAVLEWSYTWLWWSGTRPGCGGMKLDLAVVEWNRPGYGGVELDLVVVEWS